MLVEHAELIIANNILVILTSLKMDDSFSEKRKTTAMTQTNWIHKRILLVLISIGALLVAAFSIIARRYSESGHVTLPQPDSAIYMQYARAIAEGHPYRFQERDPPSTGSTSHLYPFVLAVPYALGAKGDALVTAGFVIGGLCFLAIIALLYAISFKLVPSMAIPATLLAGVLNGHLLFACLGVTDVGLFALLALSLFAAALYKRWAVATACLVLAVFCRPEGAVLSAAFFGVGLMGTLFLKNDRKKTWPLLITGLVGLIAVGGVMLLNIALTGISTFHSVLGKSPLMVYPFSEVVYRTIESFVSILRELFFGVSDGKRQFYMFPILGGILFTAGLILRPRENKPIWLAESAFGLGIVTAILLVASSDWTGLFWDRYFAWLIPVMLIYCAISIEAIKRQYPSHPHFWKGLLALMLLFQCGGMLYFATVTARLAAKTEPQVLFAKVAGDNLSPGETVISSGMTGIYAYYMPRQYIISVQGIVTPQLSFRCQTIGNIEVLKHWRGGWPNYWLVNVKQSQTFLDSFLGERLDTSSMAFGNKDILLLHKANWSVFQNSLQPQSTALQAMLAEWEQADQLDVANPIDETRSDYRVFSRFPGARSHPFPKISVTGQSDPFFDAGRLIYGSETFQVQCPRPGQDMLVVMRTGLKAKVSIVEPMDDKQVYEVEFASPLQLPVFVDGHRVGEVVRPIENPPGNFSEIHFIIPGKVLKSREVEIVIGGDHFSYGYWFYQKPESSSLIPYESAEE